MIADNQIHGFRPTHPNQDASGGQGTGLMIHQNAKNIVIEKNHIYNNTKNLYISTGSEGTAWEIENIIIKNNLFSAARDFSDYTNQDGVGLLLHEVKNTKIFNNTFVDNQTYALISWGAGLDNQQTYFKNNLIRDGQVYLNNASQVWDSDYNLWSNLSDSLPPKLSNSHDINTSSPKLNYDSVPPYQLYTDSPAKDAGTNLSTMDVNNDYLNTNRPQGSAYDIGAYEYTVSDLATPTPPSATNTPADSEYDLNGDKKVDINDLLILLRSWGLSSYLSQADFNNDGKINSYDFILLVVNI